MPGFARPLNTSKVSGRPLNTSKVGGRPLNTFKVSGRNSLRGLYKDSLTSNGPLRFQAAVVITLPNEEDLTRIISTPQEDRAIPHQRTPLLPLR
jgi:hypothetical protein